MHMQEHICVNDQQTVGSEGKILPDKSDTEPAHSLVFLPFNVVLTNDTFLDHVYTHDNTFEDGKLATPHLVNEQKCWDTSHGLADVDHTTKNERHFVALTKSSKENRGVVYESIYT